MRSQRIAGALVALIVILTFAWIVYATPMETFKGIPGQIELSELSEALPETARFLWGERLLNVVSQAFIVFSAVIGALALFRGEKVD